MKAIYLGLFLFIGAMFSSCESITMIQSAPEGAKVYMDGQMVGTTPHLHKDEKIIFSKTSFRLEKEGYEPYRFILNRNEEPEVGAIVGGFFTGGITWLWSLGYTPERTFELVPSGPAQPGKYPDPLKGMADKLRLLKELYDEGILTQEEYEQRKKKILEEHE